VETVLRAHKKLSGQWSGGAKEAVGVQTKCVLCCAVLQVLPELPLEDTALFFARAGAAAYDASITGWKVRMERLTACTAGEPACCCCLS
jgi:hypothetical protein